MTVQAPERVYPVTPMDGDADPRFTFGLLIDVVRLIEAHGYPSITGRDAIELQLALFRFLYGGSDAAG